MIGREASVLHIEALSYSYHASEACQTLKKIRSFIARNLNKILNIMGFRTLKQFIAKTVLKQTEKM